MDIHITPGDGYCFLNSVVYCLQNDYNDSITLEELIRKIVSHMCLHYEDYTNFHTFAESPLPPSDTLIEDALEFFKYGNYMSDIVDLLMQITAYALCINLFIYQKSRENIQVLNFQHPLADRIVRVRFTHDNIHSQGNHYDSIICVWPQLPLQSFPSHGNSVITITPQQDCSSTQQNGSSTQSDTSTNTSIINNECCFHPHQPPPSYSSVMEERVRMNKGKIIDLTIDDSDSDLKSDTTYFSPSEGVLSQNEVLFPPPPYTFTSSSDTTRSTLTSSNEDLSIKVDLQESEMQALLKNISRGKPFPTCYFRDFPVKHVAKLPKDVDGLQLYKIKAGRDEWLKLTSDNRHFLIMTTTRSGYVGELRIGTCMGSYICRNPNCPFVLTSRNHAPNKVSWRIPRGRRGVGICTICDHIAERESCGAKKMIEYDTELNEATVYHIGRHSCWPKVNNAKRTKEICNTIAKKNLRGSAKDVCISQISELIEAGDMEGAACECYTWVDRRAVERELQYSKPTYGIDNNSFDAVGLVKRKTDTWDPYYVYEIGNQNYITGNKCDYVFKSSCRMAKMAIQMDQDGQENLLQMENAYFDATHSCVHGFKTIGLWLIHPAILKKFFASQVWR